MFLSRDTTGSIVPLFYVLRADLMGYAQIHRSEAEQRNREKPDLPVDAVDLAPPSCDFGCLSYPVY